MPAPGVAQPPLTEPASRVSQAALHGGTTTTIDFAPVEGGMNVQQAIEFRQQQWAGQCYGDYAFHTMLLGRIAPEILGRWPRRSRPAIPASRCSHRHHALPPGPHGRFSATSGRCASAAKAGGIAAIHAEDNDIVMHMYEKLIRETAPASEHGRGPQYLERGSVVQPRVIRLAPTSRGRRFIHDARPAGDRGSGRSLRRSAMGVPIYGETAQY